MHAHRSGDTCHPFCAQCGASGALVGNVLATSASAAAADADLLMLLLVLLMVRLLLHQLLCCCCNSRAQAASRYRLNMTAKTHRLIHDVSQSRRYAHHHRYVGTSRTSWTSWTSGDAWAMATSWTSCRTLSCALRACALRAAPRGQGRPNCRWRWPQWIPTGRPHRRSTRRPTTGCSKISNARRRWKRSRWRRPCLAPVVKRKTLCNDLLLVLVATVVVVHDVLAAMARICCRCP